MQTDSYWSGYDDYKRGRHLFDNPYNYDYDLSQFLRWEEGYWVAYEEDRKDLKGDSFEALCARELKEQENPED